MAFRLTYLMLPKPHGSSTVTTRPPVAAEDVHRNGSIEEPSTNTPVDDRCSVSIVVGRQVVDGASRNALVAQPVLVAALAVG